jgi:hypothetical protein
MRPPLDFLYDLFHKTNISSMNDQREIFMLQYMFPLIDAVTCQIL